MNGSRADFGCLRSRRVDRHPPLQYNTYTQQMRVMGADDRVSLRASGQQPDDKDRRPIPERPKEQARPGVKAHI
ncbi:hypothetical protein BaRGS_00027386 [Batillaria attramentaria]|uniref:Uncharacterized protein n=1 Tax=Batillaria attramentaria TaxID=370345 RepID=A0ABD0K1Z6_9CAEN